MVHVASSFWLLAVESHALYLAEKDLIARWAEQILKMTSIFTQKQVPLKLFLSQQIRQQARGLLF